jgi:hypothetical protein
MNQDMKLRRMNRFMIVSKRGESLFRRCAIFYEWRADVQDETIDRVLFVEGSGVVWHLYRADLSCMHLYLI